MKVASWMLMQAIPRISGLDFARGLIRVGHRMTGNTAGYLLLERGTRAVTVPLLDELQPPLLHFLLLGAGVSLSQVVSALQTPSQPPPQTIRSSTPASIPANNISVHSRT
jgi:hypothetical protein